MLKALKDAADAVHSQIEQELVEVGVIPGMDFIRENYSDKAKDLEAGRAQDIQNMYDLINCSSHYEEMYEVLKRCDHAFACWQLGVVPGRPEDILALTSRVREVLNKVNPDD